MRKIDNWIINKVLSPIVGFIARCMPYALLEWVVGYALKRALLRKYGRADEDTARLAVFQAWNEMMKHE